MASRRMLRARMPAPSGDILNKKIVDGADVSKECGKIEEDIAALRMSYEQYFLGLDRRPPTTEHSDLKRRMQQLKSTFVRQTALKFRVQAIQAKLVTYERLWSRTLQEMENGTYRRDLFKAKLHAQERAKKGGVVAPELSAEPKTDTSGQPMAAAPPAAAAPTAGAPRPARPAPAHAPAPAAAASAGGNGALAAALSDQKLKQVFEAYVTAKKRCQEDTSKLSYEQVAANLRKQVPDLVKKAGAQNVEFKIIIKDGKAVLRAVPK